MEVCSGGGGDDEDIDNKGARSTISQKHGQGREKRSLEEDETEGDRAVRRKLCREEDLRVLVKFKEGSDINDVGLFALTHGLKKALGDIEMAKILRDGRLLITCKNVGQRDKALKLQSVCKKEASEVRKFGDWGTKGVISGIPLGKKLDELRKVIKGGTVLSVKRLQATRNGEKMDSPSVLLEFKEQVLPERVMIGYMSFYVREYVPPPVRCYKCQRYGHIAKICKGKQRCGKCGGEHEYGECGESEERKCCNCGGNHTAAYGGCPVRKRAVAIQQVRSSRNLSYAEAVKAVKAVDRDSKEGRQKESQAQGNEGGGRSKEEAISTEKLILFIAYVVNCADQARTRTEKIKIIVKAASKFLNIGNLSWEKIQTELIQSEMSESSQPS